MISAGRAPVRRFRSGVLSRPGRPTCCYWPVCGFSQSVSFLWTKTFPEATPGSGRRPGTTALVNSWVLSIGRSHFAQVQGRLMCSPSVINLY